MFSDDDQDLIDSSDSNTAQEIKEPESTDSENTCFQLKEKLQWKPVYTGITAGILVGTPADMGAVYAVENSAVLNPLAKSILSPAVAPLFVPAIVAVVDFLTDVSSRETACKDLLMAGGALVMAQGAIALTNHFLKESINVALDTSFGPTAGAFLKPAFQAVLGTTYYGYAISGLTLFRYGCCCNKVERENNKIFPNQASLYMTKT